MSFDYNSPDGNAGPDPIIRQCGDCDGKGTIIANCCSGRDCGCLGLPGEFTCETCKGAGQVEMSAEKYDEMMRENEADLKHDDI